MNLIAGFNWLDFVIIFLIIAGMAIGLTQGLLRQMIGLAALYIGTILGAQYYRVIGDWIRTLAFQSAAPNKILNAFSFFLILIFVSSIINWLAYDAYRSTKLQLAPLLDQLGGALLGLVTMIILISIMLPVLGFATSEPWPWNEPARQFIADGMQSFRLLPVFNELKPLLLSVLGPWLPAGLPSLFDLAR
jgi:uncharacterized membrane protein required for colicin V production